MYQPDIPQNLGAAVRIAACFRVGLDVIEPCGFLLTDKAVKRAAMDYGAIAEIRRHDSFASFHAAKPAGHRLVLMTTKSATPLQSFAFRPGDILMMGRESAGAPDDVHALAEARLNIPIHARSLNVSVAAGVAVFEALRQLDALPSGA